MKPKDQFLLAAGIGATNLGAFAIMRLNDLPLSDVPFMAFAMTIFHFACPGNSFGGCGDFTWDFIAARSLEIGALVYAIRWIRKWRTA